MPITKPTKPSITLPSAFGTSPSNVKTPYTAKELVDGYSASIQQILDGGNLNWLNDTFFKFLTYTTAICDWLNGTPTKKIPFINSSNQLDYMDAPAGNIIGQIISCVCTSSYVPDGCLPCDGQEYAKSQFSDLWTNFLTSNPAKLNVCTYEQYQSDISTYGQCGKFAIDTTNNKFKAPTIKDGSYLTQAKSDTELGKAYNESLPNHTHTISSSHGLFIGNAAGGWANNLDGTGQTNTTGGASSSTYQNGAKVQGDNIRVRFFVVVSNGQINQSQMDWSQWASSLSVKANTDLSNINSNIDYVVESYNDGTNWYRLYKSGWCEQGGKPVGTSSSQISVNLLKPYKDTNYTILNGFANTSGTDARNDPIVINNITTSGFKMIIQTTSQMYLFWQACGYIA